MSPKVVPPDFFHKDALKIVPPYFSFFLLLIQIALTGVIKIVPFRFLSCPDSHISNPKNWHKLIFAAVETKREGNNVIS